METRHNNLSPLSLPAIRDDGGSAKAIVGYGAVFYRESDPDNTQFELWDNVYERIAPGAFNVALDPAAPHDVRSLFNHDQNIILGRTSAGTLSLKVDETGLHYRTAAPDTQLVRDQVLAPIERGDVSGSSFMFRPTRVEWLEVNQGERRYEVRQINEVELIEVGPVAFPAYSGTTTDVTEARTEYDYWKESPSRGRVSAKRRRQIQIAGRLIEWNLA